MFPRFSLHFLDNADVSGAAPFPWLKPTLLGHVLAPFITTEFYYRNAPELLGLESMVLAMV